MISFLFFFFVEFSLHRLFVCISFLDIIIAFSFYSSFPSFLYRHTHFFFTYCVHNEFARCIFFHSIAIRFVSFVSCSWKTGMHESSRHFISHMYLFFLILRSTVYRVHHSHCYHTEYNIGWPMCAHWYHALFSPSVSPSFLVYVIIHLYYGSRFIGLLLLHLWVFTLLYSGV